MKPQREDHASDGTVFVWMRSGAHRPHGRSVTHQHAALAFCLKGSARVELATEWRLEAGDVLIVPAGAPHRSIERKATEVWGVGFCVSCFAPDAPEVLVPFERVRAGSAPVVRLEKSRRPFVQSLLRELSQTKRAATPVQRALLTLIVAEVERARGSSSSGVSNVVGDALRFIERNCLRALTLRDVARAVRKSESYVTRTLSQKTGRSAVEWIIACRLSEARRLLLHSDESVEVIAERVGYADPTHFIRLFKRESGLTPAQWRKTPSPSARGSE